MNTEKPLHIVSLTAENVKRLQAVTIRPNGEVVLIGGQNAQGKTSLLDSIEMALGGGKTIPVEPVRRGSRKARIVVDLGEIVVERTFSPKGTALEIRNAEGVPVKSPQSLLDKLCAKVAFDPLGFAREEPKKQDEILKQVLGVDFSQLDAKREALFAKRRDIKRDAKQLEARLDAMVQHSGVPAEEVSVTALTVQLEQMRDQADENRKVREQLEQHRVDHSKAKTKVAKLREEMAQLQRQLDAAEQDVTHYPEPIAELEAKVAALVEPDTAAVREQIARAGETNRKVRENAERARLDAELREQLAEVAELSSNIEAIDDTKADMLATAKFPVPGLGFDETGPTLNGIPLSQCSQAERLRVSVAIGAALNPRVKVMLVRDGSLLDDKSLALLAQLAHETDSQLWVERVGDRDQSAVIIEDGMVRGAVDALEEAS